MKDEQPEFHFRKVSVTGRQKAIKVNAVNFKNALSKGLALHGHLKYNLPKQLNSKKMDLATAIARASKASKDTGRPYYVIADDKNGECSVNAAPIGTPIHKFVKGKEDMAFTRAHVRIEEKKEKKSKVKPTVVSHEEFKAIKQFKNEKTQITMSTKEKEKAAAKKGAAKKAAPAKKEKRAKYTDGKKVTMTNKEMTAKIKKGYSYFNEKGVNKTKYIPERPNQTLVNKDYYEVAPE